MADVVKCGPVSSSHEPIGKRINLQASCTPSRWISRWSSGPDVGSCAERLLEFKSSINLVSILNRTVGSAGIGVDGKSVLDSTVTVVADLDLVRRTCWKSAVETGYPRDVGRQIGGHNSVLVS